jgi:uncharacterized protein (DUF2062 family)
MVDMKPELLTPGLRRLANGGFVAFTPTIGFQTTVALILATLLKANRPAAVVLVWINNLLTIVTCFAFS